MTTSTYRNPNIHHYATLLVVALLTGGLPLLPMAQAASIRPPAATIKDLNEHRQYTSRLDGPADGTAQAHAPPDQPSPPPNPARDAWTLQYTNATSFAWTDFHIRIRTDVTEPGTDFSAANEGITKAFFKSGFGSDFNDYTGASPEFFFDLQNGGGRDIFKDADFQLSGAAQPL
jgi:hypothetical protein